MASQPKRPGFVSPVGPGYDLFKNEAMRKGPSGWLGLAKRQGEVLSRNEREKASVMNAGRTAENLDALAAKGGLSSGARERAITGGTHDLAMMNQDITRQNQVNDMQLGITDAENKYKMISMLPGMEADRIKAQNDYNMDLYKSQMQAWAAKEQAKATSKSGKK